MSHACPITNETVDERGTRILALLVLLVLTLTLALASPWLALLLAADFGLRGFGARSLSPLRSLARSILVLARLAPRPTNAGPKVFAAKLGFGFSLAVGLALLLGNSTLALVVGEPFAACAILEGAFGYCVGCRIYQLLQPC